MSMCAGVGGCCQRGRPRGQRCAAGAVLRADAGAGRKVLPQREQVGRSGPAVVVFLGTELDDN